MTEAPKTPNLDLCSLCDGKLAPPKIDENGTFRQCLVCHEKHYQKAPPKEAPAEEEPSEEPSEEKPEVKDAPKTKPKRAERPKEEPKQKSILGKFKDFWNTPIDIGG